MLTDEEIAREVESLLRQSDPNSFISDSVIKQLESKIGLDLSHKAAFIRDQISLLLGFNPHPLPLHPQQFPSHFSLHPYHYTPVGAKRRGGPGGLNKVCSVSPELQAIVGEPALSRTEIVKQLWAYIKKNKLQDPCNKRKIICDNALRMVFETDMFKMNKLLTKHIIALEPSEASNKAKKAKVDAEPATTNAETGSSSIVISKALAKFLGTGEREMPKAEALRLVWEYINVNHLEDPLNSTVMCDPKLHELLGCRFISAQGLSALVEEIHCSEKS
ncbi:hypothetical protein UlMin_012236 [Ulmus minor]